MKLIIDVSYEVLHGGLIDLDDYLEGIVAIGCYNYEWIRTEKGWNYVNIGEVLINRSIMERALS